MTDETSKRAASQIIKHIGFIIFDIILIIIVSVTFLAAYFYYRLDVDTTKLTENVFQTSIIYDRTGSHILYEIHGEENRKIVPHNAIPDNVRLATIAAEDERFYSHSGIDIPAIFRAIKKDLESNQIQQGASTITQQLARNAYLTRERTFQRKIMEIFLAFKIEQEYSKDQILDMYLNEIPYGSNAYGIESAAETFFGKEAARLTLDEAATLSALPNAPTILSPYGNNRQELLKKRDKILTKMSELKLAGFEEIEEAKKINTLEKIMPFKQPIDSPHFVFHVREQLEKMYGKDMVEKGGLKVYTTLDYDLQKIAESIIESATQTNMKNYQASNAALVSLDPKNGQILTMVGSRNYFDTIIDGQVNVAISPRQPGSSFKPFAYAKAFEKGYQPETLLYDVPTNFGPDGTGEDYKPQNYDGNFHGLVSMREALAMSLNIPAVKTLYLAGINETIDFAHRLGITTLNDRDRYGLALVLGGGEVTLLDETAGMSVFANDGKKNQPTGILTITDNHGKTIYTAPGENEQVIHPEIARKINSVLSDNNARARVFGLNNKLHIPGRQTAAKTGTTQAWRDAWTIGYTPSLITGVWVGNNDNTPMRNGADGSYVAAPIWHDFMFQALSRYPEEQFIDYNRDEVGRLFSSNVTPRVVYYNNKTGKKLSEKKLKKTNPEKIEMRFEFPNNYPIDNQSLVAELQSTRDPMILGWRNSIQSSYSSIDKEEKKD